MRQLAFAIVLASSVAFAAEPTTKPKDIAPTERPPEQLIGPVIDTRRPAFIPKFAQVNNPPGGGFAERDWARMNTYPAPLLYWPGYYGVGVYGYYRYGWVFSPSHAYLR